MKKINFILVAWIIVTVLALLGSLALFIYGIVMCCLLETGIPILISIFAPIGFAILWIFANCVLQMMENVETTAEYTEDIYKKLDQVVNLLNSNAKKQEEIEQELKSKQKEE